jgi:hypothetical protein
MDGTNVKIYHSIQNLLSSISNTGDKNIVIEQLRSAQVRYELENTGGALKIKWSVTVSGPPLKITVKISW